jgi:polysaccharide export outer membrane protein
MKSGISRFFQFSLFALALAGLIAHGAAQAQQPTPVEPSSENGQPVLPAGQTPEQAATSASGATQTPPKTNDGDKDVAQAIALTIGPGDMIEVNVFNVPELTSKVRISNTGEVYLPLIDYVHVGGLTTDEAQAVIQKRLEDGGFVRNPHVTVFVDEASSQAVTVIGEVARPGIYPDAIDHKLYEVVSEAGGFTSSASRKIAIIRRNQPEPIRVDLPRNLADDLSGNVEIMPGDTISVPRAPIIYVVGDVGRPSGLLVDNGSLTVLQALALAGGPNHTAKLGESRIVRKGPNGMVELKLQIKKMLEAKAPDMPLQADDILFIPVSRGKVLAAATFSAAMSAATAVTIYTIHP